MRQKFKSGGQNVVVDDFDLLRLLVLEEALLVRHHLVRLDRHLGFEALGLDRDREHVLPDAIEVNHEHHVIGLLEHRCELDHDFYSLVPF